MGKDLVKAGKQLPEEFRSPEGLPIGTEGIEGDDLILPRLKIIQSTSLDEEEGIGKLKNTVTGEVFDKVIFTPITFRKGWLCFDPEETHSAPISRCFSEPDPEDESEAAKCWRYGNWYKATQKYPNCADVYEFTVVTEDNNLCAISFKGTGVIEIKKLITIIKFRRIPFFFNMVEISTEKVKNEKGVFFIPKLKMVIETSDELRHYCLELLNTLAKKNVEVDYEPSN